MNPPLPQLFFPLKHYNSLTIFKNHSYLLTSDNKNVVLMRVTPVPFTQPTIHVLTFGQNSLMSDNPMLGTSQ